MDRIKTGTKDGLEKMKSIDKDSLKAGLEKMKTNTKDKLEKARRWINEEDLEDAQPQSELAEQTRSQGPVVSTAHKSVIQRHPGAGSSTHRCVGNRGLQWKVLRSHGEGGPGETCE